MTEPRLDFQRIKVNAQGYDSSGAYWGAGPDVFIVRYACLRHDATSTDGRDEITVRARTVAEARKKVADERARKPGEARSGKSDPIGGNAPHKSRYEIDWRNPVTNELVRIRITHAREYLYSSNDHLEIESLKPQRAPLPITETGYRSHFISPLDLINAGGPVTFVTAWINQEAKGKARNKVAAAKAQGDLFSWAEAQGEVGKRGVVKGRSSKLANAQTNHGQVVLGSDGSKTPTPRRHDGKTAQRQKRSRDPS